MTISKRGLSSVVDILRDFLRTSDKSSKCLEIALPKPKVEIGSTKSKDNLFAHYYNDIIEHPKRQIRLPFCFRDNISCVSSIKNPELHGNHFFYRNCQTLPSRNSPSLQEPILRCKQVWIKWEQLRCGVHATLIFGMTIALLISLESCIVRI